MNELRAVLKKLRRKVKKKLSPKLRIIKEWEERKERTGLEESRLRE